MNLERYRVRLAVAAGVSAPLVLGILRFVDSGTPVAMVYRVSAAWLALTAVALLATRISACRLYATAHVVGTIFWLTVIASRLYASDATGQALDTLTADMYLVLALLCVIAYSVFTVARAALFVNGTLILSTALVGTWALLPGTVERDPNALGVAAGFQVILVVIAQMTHVLAKARSERDAAFGHAERWRALADHDPLTGLPNRRYLERALAREHAVAEREDAPLSLLYIDVDHFKAFNDRYGHAAGDDVLAHIGEVMRAQLRVSDPFGRWGGEEFLAILPRADADAALRLAERLRHGVATHPGPAPTTVTISVGVATSPPGGSPEELVETADRRLYEAKRLGRNRAVGPAPVGGSPVAA